MSASSTQACDSALRDGHAAQAIIVKNTFITVLDQPSTDEVSSLQKSQSDSNLGSLAPSCSVSVVSSRRSSASASASKSDVDCGAGDFHSSESKGVTDSVSKASLSESVAESAADDPAALAAKSKGSVHHGTGRCRPCKFFVREGGCALGTECAFCHMSHRKTRARPAKSVRSKCKEIANSVDPDDADETVEALADKSPYLRNLLRARFAQMQSEQVLAGKKQSL